MSSKGLIQPDSISCVCHLASHDIDLWKDNKPNNKRTYNIVISNLRTGLGGIWDLFGREAIDSQVQVIV